MSKSSWPDALQPPDRLHVQELLNTFWAELADLAELLPRQQFLLTAEKLHELRQIILQMMLALNGIQRPATQDLNAYLSNNQRTALERTLLLPTVDRESQADAWIGQAVSLVVIYRWYAPQLVAKYGLSYPEAMEQQASTLLLKTLPAWPQAIRTD